MAWLYMPKYLALCNTCPSFPHKKKLLFHQIYQYLVKWSKMNLLIHKQIGYCNSKTRNALPIWHIQSMLPGKF